VAARVRIPLGVLVKEQVRGGADLLLAVPSSTIRAIQQSFSASGSVAGMKGHIREVVPGKKFRVYVYEGRDPVTGRKRYRTKVVAGTRRDAEATLHQMAADVSRTPTREMTTSATFGDLVERWFTMMSPGGRLRPCWSTAA
jgi:hypothetical protein